MSDATKPLDIRNVEEAKAAIADLQVYGNGDAWVLLVKASSATQKWMKSTKALEIPGLGCLVQVTTDIRGQVAEAVTFVPGCRLKIQEGTPRLVAGIP